MRLSKKDQYALLFVIYLQRSGLTTTQTITDNLEIPHSFAEQIARKLRIAGIISVRRGPGGGYKITHGKTPTVSEVLKAVGDTSLMSRGDTLTNSVRGTEGRILNHIVGSASSAFTSVLNQTVESFATELVMSEVEQLNSLTENSVIS